MDGKERDEDDEDSFGLVCTYIAEGQKDIDIPETAWDNLVEQTISIKSLRKLLFR